MGKFIGWDVAVAAPAACSNCGMHKEQKKGCCNDKHKTFQLKKDQVATTINYTPTNKFVYIHHKYLLLNNAVLFINKDVADAINGPPLIQTVPSFIYNCVFRI